ncbi:MAG: hypothetical protein ABW000_20790 [Actinoplanes sp.]
MFVVALGVVLVPRLLNSEDDGPLPVAAAEQDPLLVAVDKCDPAKEGAKLADRNRKLIINGAGEKFPVGLNEDQLACVFSTLDVPVALSDRMASTVSADGQLQGDWPGFTVVWTNDKSKGLDLTVTRN